MTASADQPAQAAAPAGAKPQDGATPDWKPEPRQWTWKDIFTAPMLAFKPKCMVVSAVTVLLLGTLGWTWQSLTVPAPGHISAPLSGSAVEFWLPFIKAAFVVTGLVIFGLGAVLVSVFLKADLLDDEFLSFGEAIGQYKSRLAPAIIVPLFLALIVAGVFSLLVWLPMVVGSIPYAGSAIYALFYPLGWFMGVFFILVCIAVSLAVFVFPGIVAARRHGWFDNVVDTIEAVGTKPHVMVGSLLVTIVLVLVAHGIGFGGMRLLNTVADSRYLPGDELRLTEERATELQSHCIDRFDPIPGVLTTVGFPWMIGSQMSRLSAEAYPSAWGNMQTVRPTSASSPYHHWGTGLIVGGWKILFAALLLGYCLNVFLSGGILTYLVVREDDYWDDEDLEDLDKLAKELEEEARREAEQGAAPAAPAASAPAAAPAAEPPKA
jgi:hypothetical protein